MNQPKQSSAYAQVFVYRVPKKNHDAMLKLEGQILDGWKKHGILGSEFFQLTNAELVRGFTDIRETVGAAQDEEVWVEVEHYHDRDHREAIFAAIRKDTKMLELFGQWYGLVTQGKNSVMGDFNRLNL